MNWLKEIAVMALVKSEIAKADRQKLWPYALPRVAAQLRQIAAVESKLGFALQSEYRTFLSAHRPMNGGIRRCFFVRRSQGLRARACKRK